MPDLNPWNLVADIGGTNARFAVQSVSSSKLDYVSVLSVEDYPDFYEALNHFLEEVKQAQGWTALPQAACLAVACPVDQDKIRFTNSHWTFSKSHLQERLSKIPLDVINDFTAVAHAIPALEAQDCHQIGGGQGIEQESISILGPGTGLGVSTLKPLAEGYTIIDGEGGHIDFAPLDKLEISILGFLKTRYPRVSAERLLSGDGILNIYQSLCHLRSVTPQFQSPSQITQAALQSQDTLALETLSTFCRVLGSTAGNLALICGARGGVYIAGGIVPRMLDFLEHSEFRARFEAKGRFKSYLEPIPVRIITRNHLGLFGAMQRVMQLT